MQTDRLDLRRLEQRDAPALFALYSHTESMRFMPTLPHTSVDETHAFLTQQLSMPGGHDWAICLKGEDEAIGVVNFLGGTRLPGMGYTLHPDHWGQGYTAEACRPVLDYGFTELGYDRVELWINEENGASIRVAEKLGFRPKGRLAQKYAHETAHHHMLVYGLLAGEWNNSAPVGTQPATFLGIEPVLPVHDVAATAEYYQDKLGFHIDFLFGEPADHAAVSRGEWSGSMVTIQLTHVPEERALASAGYLYILVDASLDQLFAVYRSKGVTLLSEPADKPWGMREFDVSDCNGHRLIFGAHQ